MISLIQIISRFAGPIFSTFTSNESVLGVDDRSGLLFFRYLKGRCHGNQLESKNWRFFADQSTLSRCHSEMDCNIAIPISKDYIE